MLDQSETDVLASVDACITTCDTRDGLADIKTSTTELVIWRRSLPGNVQTWIDGIDTSALPHVRILVGPADLRAALEPEFDACGLTRGDKRDVLLGDIEELVSAFADITDSELIDVRLERIDDDACWKFHRDTVEARLLTTYRGPATEWVPMAHAERAIAEQTEYDGPLHRLGDGDVALFKGNCAGPGRGVVHRSPPIEGTDQTRLLLCLNQRTVVSPEPWTG